MFNNTCSIKECLFNKRKRNDTMPGIEPWPFAPQVAIPASRPRHSAHTVNAVMLYKMTIYIDIKVAAVIGVANFFSLCSLCIIFNLFKNVLVPCIHYNLFFGAFKG